MRSVNRGRQFAGALAVAVLLAACGSGSEVGDAADPPADTGTTDQPGDPGDPEQSEDSDASDGSEGSGDTDGSGTAPDAPAASDLPGCEEIAATPAGTDLLAGLDLQDAVSGVTEVEDLVSLRCVWSSPAQADFSEVQLQLLIDPAGTMTSRELAETAGVATDDPRLAPLDGFVFTADELDLEAPLVGGSAPIVVAGTARVLLSLTGGTFRGDDATFTNDLAVQLGAEVLGLL